MDVAALPALLETLAEAIDATVDAATMLKAPLMKLRREVSALVTVSPSNISVLFMLVSGGLLLSPSKHHLSGPDTDLVLGCDPLNATATARKVVDAR
jgi:hypothetical protein